MTRSEEDFMQGATIRPGDYRVGSAESRAAARFLLDLKRQMNTILLIHRVPRPWGNRFNSIDKQGESFNLLKIDCEK